MRKKIYTFLTAFTLLSVGAIAQNTTIYSADNIQQEEFKKVCGTTAPPIEWENWMQQKVADLKANANKQGLTATSYTIPIIFHILHSGEPIGVGRNIAAARAQEQIDRLNQDYSKTNSDFSKVPPVFQTLAASFDISFCLAKVDANGNTLKEPGIDRINIVTKDFKAFPWATDYMNTTVKPATIWNPEQFLNVWVFTPAALSANSILLGYATFPANSGLIGLTGVPIGTATTDGFAVNFLFLGTNAAYGSTGRTATHEIGHWLGLRHIWGDADCANDYCNDTPPQKTYNYGCKTHPYNKGVCPGDTTGEMFMNYMDYSDDGCLNMFTNDQKTRAIAALNNSPMRKKLITSTKCDKGADLPPKANLTADKKTVTVGGTVNFYDLSLNIPTSWLWNFDGATPSTSTEQNPTGITYPTIGTYSVSLTAWNAIGKDSVIKVAYINVVNVTSTCDTLRNYSGTDLIVYSAPNKAPNDSGYVSGTSYLKNKAIAEKYNALPGKSVTGVSLLFGKVKVNAAHTATTMVKINVWSADNTGAPSTVLASKSVLLSSIDTTKFTNVDFMPAINVSSPFFVGFEIPETDSVAVFTSKITDGLINLGWVQDVSGKWATYTSKYRTGLLNNIIYPVFCPTSGGVVVTDDLQQRVTIYPNPSTGEVNVNVSLSVNDKLTLEVINLLGEVVLRKQQTNSTGGTFSLNLNGQAAGCYFIKVSNSNSSTTKRIVIRK